MDFDEAISTIEDSLNASTYDTDKHIVKMAVIKEAAQDMTDEERKEARQAIGGKDEMEEMKKSMRKAMEEKDPEEMKKAMEEVMGEEEDEKKGRRAMEHEEEDEKKGRRAMEHEEEDEKDKKIASLTASLNYLMAKPLVDKMLSARRDAGMDSKSLERFQKSLYGKSIKEIKARHAEDQALYPAKQLMATTVGTEIPFNGESDFTTSPLEASGDGEPLEAMFE